MVETLYSISLILLLSIILCTLLYERVTKISASPVMPWVLTKALARLRRHKTKDKAYNIVDLGAGWGGSTLRLKKAFPNAYVTGHELSPWPYLIAKARTCWRTDVCISRQDFFEKDLSHYDIVYCYLSIRHMKKLRPQLGTLKPGSVILSCSFPIKDWTPVESLVVKGAIDVPIYIYKA
jgi:trans-aconitate methyltransferase